ncbi:MAG: hypothetical protein FWH14_05485 [Oscillospiraceae bacterium]|nr:hypothetical protein [Oscillospiraceae bacterium]
MFVKGGTHGGAYPTGGNLPPVVIPNCRDELRSSVDTTPTALPKGEPRMSHTNSVGVLASPLGRGVMR